MVREDSIDAAGMIYDELRKRKREANDYIETIARASERLNESIAQQQYVILSDMNNQRQSGRTTYAIQQCLEHDGIYVVHDSSFRHQLKNQYPELEIVDILDRELQFKRNKVLFIDHHVYELAHNVKIQNTLQLLHSSMEVARIVYPTKPTPNLPEAPKEFKINEYLTVKLEFESHLDGNRNWQTNIYVNGKKFKQCKFLLLNLEVGKEYNEIESIDEAAKVLSRDHEHNKSLLTPEEEFQGHCSNLQAWVENGYDLRIIHTNLGFPLAKELTKLGVKEAEMAVKEEILSRMERGNVKGVWNVHKSFIGTYFTHEEREQMRDLFSQQGLGRCLRNICRLIHVSFNKKKKRPFLKYLETSLADLKYDKEIWQVIEVDYWFVKLKEIY